MTETRTNKASNIEDIFPLSPLQEGMLFHTLYAPSERPYLDHIVSELHLHRELDKDALRRAFQNVVDRHQTLRTAFIWKLDKTQQVVLRRLALSIQDQDWQALSSPEQQERLALFLEEDRARGYQLAHPPLMRVTLIRLSEKLYLLVFSYHHIIMDGWSIPIVFKEFLEFYAAFAHGETLELSKPRPFRSYINWLRKRDPTGADAFWRKELEGVSGPTPLNYDWPASNTAWQGKDYDEVLLELPIPSTMLLQGLAKQHGLTINTLIRGAWALLLSRYANTEDVLFGSVVSGRPHDLTGVESMVGLFTNTLPVRVKMESSQKLLPWLKQLQVKQFDQHEYEWSPLAKMYEWSAVPRGVPLFESVIILQNLPVGHVSGLNRRGFEFQVVRHDPKNNFPLTLMVVPRENLSIRMFYDCRRFERSTIQRSVQHLRTILESMTSCLDQHLLDLPFLTEAEKHQLLVEWNDSALLYDDGICAHEQFEFHASRTPDTIAAIFGDQHLSYAQLNCRANLMARMLLEHSLEPEAVIALLGERSLDFLIAVLAIFKAGYAYLPLDPHYPEQRLQLILELSAVPLIVTSDPFLSKTHHIVEQLSAECRPRILILEELLREQPQQEASGNLPPRCGSANLAYVIYTSGSTGVPKGVMIEHRGLLNHLRAKIADLQLTERHVVGQTASQCFVISVWQFLAALQVGAHIHILDDETTHDPVLLLDKIEKAGLSIVEIVPSMLRTMLDEIERRDAPPPSLSTLSCLITTGEELPLDLCQRWMQQYPAIPLLNAYGPTECSDDVAHHFMIQPPTTGSVRVPIGRPVANMRLYVLDRWLQPAAIGIAGELFVAGIGVGRGYLKAAQRTAEVFIPDPFARQPGQRLYRTGDLARRLQDGTIEFLGRIDNQVKIRGFRIELGEIEAHLRQHPFVRDAVVLARNGEDDSRERHLTAYVVPDPESANQELPNQPEVADRVGEWQMIFDEAYSQKNISEKDPSLHFSVWVNSYTGQRLSEDEVLECVEDSVGRMLSLQPKRVLELGCGSGLILFRLAPNCEEFCGTDVSEEALRYLQQRLSDDESLSSKVSLLRRSAENFDGIDKEHFDLIVINEVVQYLPDVKYLAKVLERAIGVVRSGGFIYVGDVRNLLLLNAFHGSIQLFQAPDSMSLEELGRRVQANIAKEKELLIAPEFFVALRQRFPEITGLRLMPKIGQFSNELMNFRYDAILEVRGDDAPDTDYKLIEWQREGWTEESLREYLSANHPARLCVAGIPNARVMTDVRALKLLSSDRGPEEVSQLRQLLKLPADIQGARPERLTRIARESDYEAEVSWLNTDATGCYDLLLDGNKDGRKQTWQTESREPFVPQPWSAYANSPLRNQLRADLAPVLKSSLRRSLPEYMVPSEFVTLAALPLTPNGKVDRKVLLALKPAVTSSEKTVEVKLTQTEELVVAIWSEILGTPVGPESHFFETGGHSLLGTQVISRVRKIFDVELPLRALFDAPTVTDFARYINGARKESRGLTSSPMTSAPRDAKKLLSFAQQRLWIMTQMEPNSWAYNLPIPVRIDGDFHIKAFEAALNEIIRRHEVLRTTFDVDDEEPVQVISASGLLRLSVVDLSGLAEAEKEAESRRLAIEESHVVFDLQKGPLWTVKQLRWSNHTSIMLFTMHHIISDAWSVGVFTSELTEIYNAYVNGKPSPLAELPIQYADFAHWQRQWMRGDILDRHLAYWKRQLAGPPPTLKLPLDHPRSEVSNSRGLNHSFRISKETSKAIESLSHGEGATLFMTLLGALKVLLHKTTGQSDIVVGTDVANRNWKETENMIGFFVNLLVLRTKISGRMTFREVLALVREVALEAYAHQELPFDLLTKELRLERGLSQTPLFDVLFVFQNVPMQAIDLVGARLTSVPLDYETARFDLALFMEETPQGLVGRWTYRTELFRPATIARLSARYEKLLNMIVERPNIHLDELELLETAEEGVQALMQEKSLNKFRSLRPKEITLPQ